MPLDEIGLKAVMDLGNLVANSQTYIDRINAMTNETVKFAADSAKNFSRAEKGASALERAFQKVKQITTGIIIADVFKGIAREVGNAAEEAADAVVQFQSLRIRLDTIVARDYANYFGVDVNEALKETAGASRELMNWVRKLSVTSPFTNETLGNVLAMSQAYGFTSEEAKELIFSVGELASAWGLGNENIQAIIYNFGQIMTQGKVTGYTLRNLARDMVPISDIIGILATKYETTKEEVTKMFKAGAIGAREFIDTFNELVQKDYPGAMERMSRTFTGAISNIQDLFQSMIGYEILGPIADEIAGSIQDLVSSLLTEKNYERARKIGQILLFSFEKMKDFVQKEVSPVLRSFFALFSTNEDAVMRFARSILTSIAWIQEFNRVILDSIKGITEFIVKITGKFENSFSSLSNNMRTWGANIVTSFANGMASALSAVVRAISWIGATIAKLLESHSPPLLLPDLEKWGTNAMLSYLKGWTEADFSAFLDISNILETMINSWEGMIDEKTLIGNLISSQVSLASLTEEFRNFGAVSSQSLARIATSSGIASEELNKYIQLSFELIQAKGLSTAVSDVLQYGGYGTFKVFDEVVSSFSDLMGIADQFGPELSSLIRSYASNSQKLIEIDSKITSAQNEVNVSTSKYNALLEELQAQLNKITDRQEDIGRIRQIDRTLSKTILTDYERERLELEKKQILVEREIRDAKIEQSQEKDRLDSVVDGYQAEKRALQDKLRTEETQIRRISDANVSSLEGQLSVLKNLIEAQVKLNELYSRMLDIQKRAVKEGAAEAVAEELEDALVDPIGMAFDKAVEDIDFGLSLDKLWEEVSAQVSMDFQKIKDIFNPIKVAWNELKTSWTNLFGDPKLKTTFDTFVGKINKGFTILKEFWKEDGPAITESIGKLVGGIVSNLFVTNDITGKSVIEILADSFIAISQTISDNGDQINKVIESFDKFVNSKAFPAFKDALSTIGTKVIPAIIDFSLKAIPPILDLLGFLVSNWRTIITVLGAFQVFGLITGVGKGVVGSAAKGLGIVLGGISIMKLLGLAGGAGAVGAGVAGATGAGLGTGVGAGVSTGLATRGLGPGVGGGWVHEFPAAVASAESLWSIIASALALGGITLGTIGIAQIIGTIVTEIQKKKYPEGPQTSGIYGALYGTPTWEQVEESRQSQLPMVDMLRWNEDWQADFDAYTEQQNSKISTWLTDTFGENSAFQTSIKTAWSGVFGEGGSLSTGWNQLFGEGGGLSIESMAGWITRTFGEEASWRVTIGTTWESIFGENGTLKLAWQGLFGENGKLSKESISSWITNTFGENAPWRVSLSSSWSSIFGENGLLQTKFKDLFGEKGLLSKQTISTWISDTFGENAPWRETLGFKWNEVFGKQGKLHSIFLGLFSENGSLSSSTISSWTARVFGENSPFRISLENSWKNIFGKNGVISTIVSSLFAPFGGLSGIRSSVLSWIETSFGDKSPFRISIEEKFKSIFGQNGLIASIIRNISLVGFSPAQLTTSGYNMVVGIENGMRQREGTLFAYVLGLAQRLTRWFNEHLGIHSASTVFMESGINIDRGLAQGLLAGIPMVKSAMSSLLSVPLNNNVVNNDNRVFVEMNPTYQQYASPSTVYHDTVAALASIRR